MMACSTEDYIVHSISSFQTKVILNQFLTFFKAGLLRLTVYLYYPQGFRKVKVLDESIV